jgi:tetratricopeptide (TPR) repeat protein
MPKFFFHFPLSIFSPSFYVFFSFFILFSCHSSKEEVVEVQAYASLSDSTRYVGINTCKQCHPSIYESYIQTGMGQSFAIASRKKTSASFDVHSLIFDKFKNLYYKPIWNEDSLYLEEFRLENSDTIFQRIERISYIIGSGQHTNSHMMNENGYVYQVPATFYTQKGHWDLPPGFENGANTRFNRKIELECMTCHNAFPKIVEGSENKYEMIPNGIDCERCHGPGSEHVKQKMAGNIIDITKQVDYSIVNPAKLPIALQLDICQRCHIQGNAVLNEGKSFYDFRPAMHLSEVMNVFMPVYKGDEDSHIMASHAERLKMSPCFIQSLKKSEEKTDPATQLRPYTNALTCVTCHNPHVSVKATNKDIFNNTCKKCHSNSVSATSSLNCTQDKQKRSLVQDNCVQCHMLRNTTIDIPHVSVTDHYIRKPVDIGTVKKIKEFVTLACINNSAADAPSRGNAFISYYEKFTNNPAFLDSAKRYFNDRTDDDISKNFKSLVRLAYLQNNFQKVITYAERVKNIFSILNRKNFSNEDAWTLYRIGEAYSALNNINLAIDFVQRAVVLGPFNLDFRNRLALLQMDAEKIEDARANFEFILSENPKYVSAYVSLGYLILSVDHDVARADSYYEKALALDPDHEQAIFNKAGTYMYLNRKKDAIAMLNRLLKINPNHINARKMLVMLKST